MSSLSFKRRRILDVLSRSRNAHDDSWIVFVDAFGDHSMGAKWQAKKDDALSRMARLGLVERVEGTGAPGSRWRITDKGRQTVARAIAKGAAA